MRKSNKHSPILQQASPETVRRELTTLIERYQPEEVMVTGMRSFAMSADALRDMVQAPKAD